MMPISLPFSLFFFLQAEAGIRDVAVTGVQTCALPIYGSKEEEVGYGKGPAGGAGGENLILQDRKEQPAESGTAKRSLIKGIRQEGGGRQAAERAHGLDAERLQGRSEGPSVFREGSQREV